jgi:hypothetical protein
MGCKAREPLFRASLTNVQTWGSPQREGLPAPSPAHSPCPSSSPPPQITLLEILAFGSQGSHRTLAKTLYLSKHDFKIGTPASHIGQDGPLWS